MLAKTPKRFPVKKVLIITVGVALIGFGIWGYIQKYQATNNPDPKIPTQIITRAIDKPDETPLKEVCKDYQVADHLPRHIELPSINTSGCIQRVGVTKDNQIAVPSNIHLAGWYAGSALPGERGNSIIDGHVQGKYEEGIFKRIGSLNPDNKIIIKYGNGQSRQFEVVSVNNYSVKQASQEQYKQLSGIDNQLTLITCGGSFDSATSTYNERTIVRARLL